MSFFELLMTGVGLSMDAFAVAVCKGLGMRRFSFAGALITALSFALFQALMPFAGFLLARTFADSIKTFDHWIAFALLALIGINMLREAIKNEPVENEDFRLDIRELLVLSVATSIDALAVGVSFAFLEVKILPSICVIFVTTFLLSFVGTGVGYNTGSKSRRIATAVGGAILVALGLKILIEHLIGG